MITAFRWLFLLLNFALSTLLLLLMMIRCFIWRWSNDAQSLLGLFEILNIKLDRLQGKLGLTDGLGLIDLIVEIHDIYLYGHVFLLVLTFSLLDHITNTIIVVCMYEILLMAVFINN